MKRSTSSGLCAMSLLLFADQSAMANSMIEIGLSSARTPFRESRRAAEMGMIGLACFVCGGGGVMQVESNERPPHPGLQWAA